MPDYDPDNVFAKILRGELPCHQVYEDERTLAFMDIMPRADGHVLVIPREPARTILDISAEGLAATIASVQRVARAVKAATGADGLTIQQFNESAGGQVVFHLHFHIIPRKEGAPMRPHSGAIAPNAELEAMAARIALELQS